MVTNTTASTSDWWFIRVSFSRRHKSLLILVSSLGVDTEPECYAVGSPGFNLELTSVLDKSSGLTQNIPFRH